MNAVKDNHDNNCTCKIIIMKNGRIWDKLFILSSNYNTWNTRILYPFHIIHFQVGEHRYLLKYIELNKRYSLIRKYIRRSYFYLYIYQCFLKTIPFWSLFFALHFLKIPRTWCSIVLNIENASNRPIQSMSQLFTEFLHVLNTQQSLRMLLWFIASTIHCRLFHASRQPPEWVIN